MTIKNPMMTCMGPRSLLRARLGKIVVQRSDLFAIRETAQRLLHRAIFGIAPKDFFVCAARELGPSEAQPQRSLHREKARVVRIRLEQTIEADHRDLRISR